MKISQNIVFNPESKSLVQSVIATDDALGALLNDEALVEENEIVVHEAIENTHFIEALVINFLQGHGIHAERV